MLKAKCDCGKELTEEDLKAYCDRCGKVIENSMLGDAVQFLIAPGDDDPDGEGPQYLAVISSDINGDSDGSHYCETCTTRLLDQSFIRDVQEKVGMVAGEADAEETVSEPDGDKLDSTEE